MLRHVFISHSTKDKEAADFICSALEAEGIKCWIAPRDIKPGEEWPVAIVRAVTSSAAMVLVFSKNADQSTDVAKETLLAVNSNINLFPVKLEIHEPTGRMMYYLTGQQWHDLTGKLLEDNVKSLVEDIKINLPDEPLLNDELKDIEDVEPENTSDIPQIIAPSKKRVFNLKIVIPLICFAGLLIAGLVYYFSVFNTEQHLIRSIHAGGNQSFILLNNGELYSFGEGFSGKLGTGNEENQLTPVLVKDSGYVVDLASGDNHSIILRDDGNIYCFGNNRFGQLGLEGTFERLNPTKIPDKKNVVSLAAGEKHSLVLLDNDKLYSFGYKSGGQLGHSGLDISNAAMRTVSLISLPQIVESLSGKDIKKVSAGFEFSLVLLNNGDVYSFGRNSFGQLGAGHTDDQMEPMKVESLSNVADVVAGGQHSLVLLNNGDLYSFGKGINGQLGHGNNDNQGIPNKVEGISDVIAIAAGKDHSLALTSAGHVYSFGLGFYGSLGHGDFKDCLEPKRIEALEGIKAIVAGNNHSIALTFEEEILTFGDNKYGQLGLGDQEKRSLPTPIEGFWHF
jgi:alpha-tubulin suppressor-like RCC1 family protein